ncbi:MAG: hypothetical protein M3065_08205 [Actinomycetota bacterium]|nr:hypothetical protein [Actinomycetota bacterium]
MLTHREATLTAQATLGRQVDGIAEAIAEPDAAVRAALIVTTMLGVTIGQQLLELETLRDATPQQMADLLRPCLHFLAHERRGLTEHPDPRP